jgi:predicted nucleic acid-binding protein
MVVPKIYIETTIFNRYFEKDRQYHQESRQLFDKIKVAELTGFTSSYVVEELEAASEPKKSDMLDLIITHNINVLKADKATSDLAEKYVKSGIIPPNYAMDAAHIASATLHDMDCIVSLNFRHINKLKTKTMLEVINKLLGYSNPSICTPMELFYE